MFSFLRYCIEVAELQARPIARCQCIITVSGCQFSAQETVVGFNNTPFDAIDLSFCSILMICRKKSVFLVNMHIFQKLGLIKQEIYVVYDSFPYFERSSMPQNADKII